MIPFYKPYIGKSETEAVLRVLKSGKLSRGKEVDAFEKEFALYAKQKYAVAVNSGTSGLHVAVKALGWKDGDEVITTPFSYIASSNALLFERVKPVFVDIDPSSLNIDVNKIEQKITEKTKGILLVHILGLPVDWKRIEQLKKKYNLKVIEDVCEAPGRPGKNFNVTKVGDISVYGFHENKQLTTGGEGGMITTNNRTLDQKCRAMRDQGRSLKKDWINNVILGFNFRMTEMQATLGRTQLKHLDRFLEKRNSIAQKYAKALKGTNGITLPNDLSKGKRSWFVYFLLFKESTERDLVHRALSKAGIGSSTNYFPPIYKFPMYRNYRTKDYPITEDVSKRILALPMYYQMTDAEIRQVARQIKASLKK